MCVSERLAFFPVRGRTGFCASDEGVLTISSQYRTSTDGRQIRQGQVSAIKPPGASGQGSL